MEAENKGLWLKVNGQRGSFRVSFKVEDVLFAVANEQHFVGPATSFGWYQFYRLLLVVSSLSFVICIRKDGRAVNFGRQGQGRQEATESDFFGVDQFPGR